MLKCLVRGQGVIISRKLKHNRFLAVTFRSTGTPKNPFLLQTILVPFVLGRTGTYPKALKC